MKEGEWFIYPKEIYVLAISDGKGGKSRNVGTVYDREDALFIQKVMNGFVNGEIQVSPDSQ